MAALIFPLYIALGLLQLAAIYAGFEDWLGLHWVIAGPLAFFAAYFPLVGTILGVAGALTAWQWSWLAALGIFVGPFVVILVLVLAAGGVEAVMRRKRSTGDY